MKVPQRITPSVAPNTGRLAPISVSGVTANAFGGAISTGLGQLGDALSAQFKLAEQRAQNTARFRTLQNFTEFETRVATALSEAKRNANPDGSDYLDTANAIYMREEEAFLMQDVPHELHDEFRYRAAEVKQRVIGDSLAFQYAASDAYFRQGISDMLSTAQGEIDQDPSRTDMWRKRLNEAIDTQTDLPTIEKENLKRNVNIALLKVDYQANSRASAVQMSGDSAAMAAAMLEQHEGMRELAYPDKNALTGAYAGHRVGIGSDTVTHPDGSVSKVTPGTRVTKEGARRDLMRRIAIHEQELRGYLGYERYAALAPNVIAGITSVAYNFGRIPGSVVRAAKTGDPMQIAAAVESLAPNPKRRKQEAAVIRGEAGVPNSNIMTDPRYADIPYEDKVALRDDVESEVRSQLAAQKAAEKLAHAEWLNSLYVGLHDGSQGRYAIDMARESGQLTDYDEIKKAEDILKKRNESESLMVSAMTKLDSPNSIWDPTDTDHKKMLNALIGDQGKNALMNADQDYMQNGVLPLIARTQDIPTDVVGTLMGMVRSSNQKQALYALDALAMIREQSPKAFDQRVPEKLARDVDFYAARSQLIPHDEILRRINSPMNAAEQALDQELRKQAREYLTQKEDGIRNIETLVGEFTDEYRGWGAMFTGSMAEMSSYTMAVMGLQKEYATWFEDSYARSGDVEAADKDARRQLRRDWAVTEVGGTRKLMKHPPELSGYPSIAGGYDWITRQVREELGVREDQTFELYSDEQTADELRRFKDPEAADAKPPSYLIVTFDEFGTADVARKPDGEIARLNFKPSADDQLLENATYDYQRELARASEKMVEWERAVKEAVWGGQTVPPELDAEMNEARETRARLLKEGPPSYAKIGEMIGGLVPPQGDE